MLTKSELEALGRQLADLDDWSSAEGCLLTGHLNPADAFAVSEQACKILRARADQAEAEVRLALAAGCPENVPMIPWLIEHGFIIHTDGVLCISQAGMRLLQ
jgi:hypothetical protein